MIVSHIDNVEGKELHSEVLKDVVMKVLVSPKEGWEGYVMRVFEVEPGGYKPRHQHPWPYIKYIIEGNGTVMVDLKDNPITAGSFAYVPSDTIHQFQNTGDTTLKFICIVPEEGHK